MADVTNYAIKKNVFPITCDWVSDASGDASVKILNYSGYKLSSILFVPGKNGDLATDLPTDQYDAVLTDIASGVDMLAGNGANRSGTAADATIVASTDVLIFGKMNLVISNAGNTKKGRVYILMQAS